MTTTRELLNHWLGRCYEAEVIKGDRSGTTPKILAQQLQGNQDLMADAEARRQEISDQLAQQCFVTKKHRDFINQAFAEIATAQSGTPPAT